MKSEPIVIAVATLLVLLLGIQTYTTFRLNDRFDQLIGSVSQAENPIKVPRLQRSTPSKPLMDDEFFKDRAWNPYEEMQHMQDEMEQMFGKSFSRFHMQTPLGSLSKTPDMDLQIKPDKYVATVNAPGADESSINVKMENQRLHISIKTEQAKEETDEKNGNYQIRERFVGEFHRILTLPGAADEANMKTEYRNGVLTITIPKK